MSLEESPDDVRARAKRKYEQVKSEVVTEEKQALLADHQINDFDSVLLVASAPRGGSSLLFDILRHHEATCSLDGEHDRWYELHGICYPAFDSDVVPADFDTFDQDALMTDLLAEVGATVRTGDRTHRVDNTLLRLPLQFPGLELPYREIRDALLDGASRISRYGSSLPGNCSGSRRSVLSTRWVRSPVRSVAPTSARRSVRSASRSNASKSAGTTSESNAG